MSFDESVSDVTEGFTKGFLEWTSDKIATFVKKLKERKLAFIEEQKTIDTVLEQYRSGEAKFYNNYIKDKRLLLLVKLGLTLRTLEKDSERHRNLRSKILDKYDLDGLHLAEFVQNGVLNKYISILLGELVSLEKFEEDLNDILKNIEKYTLFVSGISNSPEIIKKVDIKIISGSPKVFIIMGFKVAAGIVQNNIDKFKIILRDYELERFSSGEKEILFFKRKFIL